MKIRVGTFNLFQFVEPPYAWYNKKDKFAQEQWLEKTAWIKQQIVKMDCDIVGFQEVFSQTALKALVLELGFGYFGVVDSAKLSESNRFKYITTTVAIASKYPIVSIESVAPHLASLEMHCFSGDFAFSRLPIKAKVQLPNSKELLVYVCHLKSNRENAFEYKFCAEDTIAYKKELIEKELEDKSSASLQQRLCEAASLFYDVRASGKRPTVLLCDLNDKEFSLTIDALTNPDYYDKQSQEPALLFDASYEYKEEVYNPHPEAKAPKRGSTSYFLGKGNVLDYIFVSDDLRGKVTNYTLFDAHLQKNRDGSLLQSDHAQVVCELSFE